MKLSKRTQYGLRAMICLARAYERGYLQTKELAALDTLPTKFLESILSALTRGKFLTSRIGATGGYRLTRPPKDILIGDIIARLEGRSLIEFDEDSSATETPGEVAVRLIHSQLSGALRTVLDGASLAELAERAAKNAGGGEMYYI